MDRRDIRDQAASAVTALLATEVPHGAGTATILSAILDGNTSVNDVAAMLRHAVSYATCVTEGDSLQSEHDHQRDYHSNAVDLAFEAWGKAAVPVLVMFAESGVYETMNTAECASPVWRGLKLVSTVTGNGRAANIAVFQSGTSVHMPTNPDGQLMLEISCADGGSILPAIPTCEMTDKQVGTIVKSILYRWASPGTEKPR